MASASDRAHTGMTSEAIGVSVAPSFFQSCVQGGHKFAKMEDVQRFKVHADHDEGSARVGRLTRGELSSIAFAFADIESTLKRFKR